MLALLVEYRKVYSYLVTKFSFHWYMDIGNKWSFLGKFK